MVNTKCSSNGKNQHAKARVIYGYHTWRVELYRVYTVEEFVKQGCRVIVTGRNNKFREHYEGMGVEYINLDITNEKGYDQLPKAGVDGVILWQGFFLQMRQ
jgi:hypothetical protein